MRETQKKMMARILACVIVILLVVMLVVNAIPTKAEPLPSQILSKTYSFQMRSDNNESGHVVSNPESAAFWEYPDLRAGQQKNGTFVVKNETTKTISVKLDRLGLSYYNSDSLKYLQHINVIITRDNKVVYDGDYGALSQIDLSKIVDFVLVPNESKTFQISLKCDFTYAGDVNNDTTQITWLFAGEDVDAVPLPNGDQPKFDVKITLLMFAGCAIGIGIILGTALRVTDKRKRFKKLEKK